MVNVIAINFTTTHAIAEGTDPKESCYSYKDRLRGLASSLRTVLISNLGFVDTIAFKYTTSIAIL